MKKIFLLGDSIRFGYQNYVMDSFKDVAEVYGAQESCRFAQHMLRWVHEWKQKENIPTDIDLVHWNVGLWDVLRIMDDGVFTPPEMYRELIKRLHNRLSQIFPNAKQVFALSTNVLEEKYEPPYQRYNKDIELLNEIAIETLAPLGVQINDLYTFTKGLPANCRSDMTHFYTEDGIKAVGGQVIKAICEALDMPFTIDKEVNAVVPQLSQELVGR
jgi:hypothetical protein